MSKIKSKQKLPSKKIEKIRIAVLQGIDSTNPKGLPEVVCGIIEALLTIFEAFDGEEGLTKEEMIKSFCELLIKRGLLGLKND